MDKVIFDITNFRFVDEKESDEEFASVSMNPTFRWCKFILTDDKPNLNKRRIPIEEFDNLVRSGLNAPIKMEVGQVGDHAESLPIGTIAALRKNGSVVEGLGALWSEERPEDVAMIKDMFDKGQTLNLSWEVIYGEKVEEPEDVIALKNTALRATTFVKLPAYAGRTPVTDFASVENTTETPLEGTELDELEQAKARITELEALLAEKETALSAKDTEISQLKSDNESLASFKSQVETEKAQAEKISAIRAKFSEAGIEKSEEYFTENRERLLAMDEAALAFMLQEMVSFASEKHTDSSSVSLPNFSGAKPRTGRELGKELRTQRK